MRKITTPEALFSVLSSRFEEEGFLTLKDLPSPFAFADMQKAAERIADAIRHRERIVVIGDYDVDGVTATTILKRFFDAIEYKIAWLIPNRFEDGYGISVSVLDKIGPCDLIVTVDNGIAALDAAEVCKARGIDLIVTDHHLLPPRLPDAYAIVDPKRNDCTFPYDEICGAQIAWYLVAALKQTIQASIDLKSLLPFTAIAIVADMMPLKHINRAMTIAGLQVMAKSDLPAFRAYKEFVRKEFFDAEDIGFSLAPLLNSAGRMEDASYAVAFLDAPNIYEARSTLQRLIAFNERRKEIEAEMTRAATESLNENDAVTVVKGKGWHEGVMGIVAARLSRDTKKPCIVLCEEGNGMLKGSGRSYGECDLFSLVDPLRAHLDKFGGHAAAIGIRLEAARLEAFKEALNRAFEAGAYRTVPTQKEIVGALDFAVIDGALMSVIKRFEPYGVGNRKPLFFTSDVIVRDMRPIGKEGAHLRFVLEHDGIIFPAVRFKSDERYEIGSIVDIVYSVAENTFRRETSLQLMIEEMRLHDLSNGEIVCRT